MAVENLNNPDTIENENHDDMGLKETKEDLLNDFQSSIPDWMATLKFNERASASSAKEDLLECYSKEKTLSENINDSLSWDYEVDPEFENISLSELKKCKFYGCLIEGNEDNTTDTYIGKIVYEGKIIAWYKNED